MEIEINGAPILYTVPILGGIPITATLVVSWCVMLVLTGLCIFLTHDMKVKNVSKRQAIAEYLVQTAENFVRGNMGERWLHYAPFIAAIFALSLGSSLAALVGAWAPTSDLSTTLAWSVVVFTIMTYKKLRTNGLGGYLKGFCDPVFLMAPFNLLGELFKPVSMAFRHFGNILSGGVVSALLYGALTAASHALFGLLPGLLGNVLSQIPFLAVGIPSILSLYFDWFGSVMQAFIFCMLTMMFISAASE